MSSYKRNVLKLNVDDHGLYQEVGDRTRHDWNCLGFKKLEKTVVTGRLQNAEVTIYFDKAEGMFGATICEIATVCRDYKALIKALSDVLAKREELVFTRYIDVDYERCHAARATGISGRHYGGHEDNGRPVVGLRLDFFVYDVSEPFEHHFHGGKAEARVWRMLERDPKAKPGADPWIKTHENIQSDAHDTDGLIPYTEDRYRVLCEIQVGIRTIESKLNTLFGERVNKNKKAALLDGFAGTKLLPSPEPEKKGRKP